MCEGRGLDSHILTKTKFAGKSIVRCFGRGVLGASALYLLIRSVDKIGRMRAEESGVIAPTAILNTVTVSGDQPSCQIFPFWAQCLHIISLRRSCC